MGKLWRIAGTGLCFAAFGLLSWLAGFILLPILEACPGSLEARRRRIRCVVSGSFRCLLWVIAALRLGYVDVHGREWLAKARGSLVVATHPTYLDIVALVGLLPRADCVAKQAMWRNLLYRRFVRASGYISNGAGPQLVNDCVGALQRGRTLILFPEGTRTNAAQPVHFRRGAAQVAVRCGCDILPVMIHCEPATLGKCAAWYQVGDRPWRITIKIFPPQPLRAFGYSENLPRGAAARRVTFAMETFFNRELAKHEYPDRRAEAAHHRLARS